MTKNTFKFIKTFNKNAADYHFSNDAKITSFKRLNPNSGLLAILKAIAEHKGEFTWREVIMEMDYEKVYSAYDEHKRYGGCRNKDRSTSLWAYATNYYNSYRSWLHNKAKAIKQTSHGHWKVTRFGKSMMKELFAYYGIPVSVK